jgi:hypothetical protein
MGLIMLISTYMPFSFFAETIECRGRGRTVSLPLRLKALLAQNLQFLRRNTMDQPIFLCYGFAGAEFGYCAGCCHLGKEGERKKTTRRGALLTMQGRARRGAGAMATKEGIGGFGELR